MAQDKELLKESINKMDNLVTKLESDNAALGNTIKLIASSNQQFRQQTIVGVLTGNESRPVRQTMRSPADFLVISLFLYLVTDDDKSLKLSMERENVFLDNEIQRMRQQINELDAQIKVSALANPTMTILRLAVHV